jgi:hypothetical protein
MDGLKTQFVASSSSARELTPGYDWDGVHLIVVFNRDCPDLGLYRRCEDLRPWAF